MKLCVIGSGYVGLVSAACFAETGQRVACVDIDADKIGRLQRGEMPIFEQGLAALVERNLETGRLSFSTDIAGAVAHAEVIMLAVGTPPRPDGGADLSAVEAAVRDVVSHVARECVLVLKSTVPVGTHKRVLQLVAASAHPIHVVSNPEFLKQGDAVRDFLHPERVLVGVASDDTFAREVMSRLYHPVSLHKSRILWMDPASAELSKYVANTMLALRISFMNEIANLCEAVGADVHQVRQAVGGDSRIGPRYLHAGPGYGGSCLPKDVAALMHLGREVGVELQLPTAAHQVNQQQRRLLASKLARHFGGELRDKIIAVWGLAFKPATDDVREAPALELLRDLIAAGAVVKAHDPEAGARAHAELGGGFELVDDAYVAAQDADALVLVTEWREYQHPDFDKLRGLMRHTYLLDGRNIWTEYDLASRGFDYEGIGIVASGR